MQRHHPGMARGIERTREAREACRRRRLLPDEEKKEKNKVPNEEKKEKNKTKCRRYRQEMKVRNSTPRHAMIQAAPVIDA
jgi:hypothetical protein